MPTIDETQEGATLTLEDAVIGVSYIRHPFTDTTTVYSPVPPNKPNGNPCRTVRISVETAAIRYTYDGTTPVSGSVGHPIPPGTTVTISLSSLANLKIIPDSVNAVAHLTWHYPA